MALSDETGGTVEMYQYGVYGTVEIRGAGWYSLTKSQFGNRYLFTGREYDYETGLYNYRARLYNPTLGRFLQTDPIGYSDGMGWYAYCGNNPIVLIDPWGLCGRSTWGNTWRGAVYGDFDGNTGWSGTGAQVGVGFIPIVGQIADARDTVAAIRTVYNDPKSWGSWGNLAMTGVAWVPGIGDAAKGAYKGARQVAKEGAQAAVKNTGQVHHAISKKIAREIENNPSLKGNYISRDPRFVTQAIDSPSHNGYQQWHRDLDDEVMKWLEDRPNATPEEFEGFMRKRYNEPDLRERFPAGLE